MQKLMTGMVLTGLLGLVACDGSDEAVTATPTAVVDLCPAMTASAAPATEPVTGAYLCAASVGVSDLEKSVTLYKALGMRETGRVARSNRNEAVMVSSDGRGARIVLFTYTDGKTHVYNRNPGKIVFFVKDATAFGAALAGAGGKLTLPPVPYGGRMVGFGRDLDNNLVEIASDATAVHSYISAIGIGVTDLEAARTFYMGALEMKETLKLSVTKPTATGTAPWYDEYILGSSANKGSSVVLMHYTDGSVQNYIDNPVKLSYGVKDPVVFAKRLTDASRPVSRAPAAATEPVLGGVVYGSASDADGTVLDFYKAAN